MLQAWHGFTFVSDFFLKTTTGKRVLYLEADATNEEDSLSLGSRARDLTIEDASQVCSKKMIQYTTKLVEVLRLAVVLLI